MIIENVLPYSNTNVVAEHVYHTLLTIEKTILIWSKLTKIYWPQVFYHVTIIKNRILHIALNEKTSLEVF
jgi:hypothetical protein